MRITSEDEQEDSNGYIPSSPLGRMELRNSNEEEEEGGDSMDLCSSLPRSVASIDSFDQRNQDYIRFQ
jgi:hypothetical protein